MAKPNFMEYLQGLPKPWKFLAPMVGNSEEAYRILAKRYGAYVCYTEMVNCKVFNICKCNPTSNQWYTTDSGDRPLVIQVCGDDPDVILQTCLGIQDHCDAIDINFGCPQEIAKKGHYGAFLQDEWDLIDRIVSKCSKDIKIPLFCKIRVFESIENSVEYAKVFERAGASLLAVHGRTREQKGLNTGLASWDHIKAIKEALSIPVIANGNLIHYEDISSCHKYTNCDGVMIAEPHLFNPCIFQAIQKSSVEIFSEYLKIVENLIESKLPEELKCSINSVNSSTAINTQTDSKCKENSPNSLSNQTLINASKYIPMGSVKSHAFKIFNSILVKIPEMRMTLDRCRQLSDYFCFTKTIEEMVVNGTITENDLRMLPNIRKP